MTMDWFCREFVKKKVLSLLISRSPEYPRLVVYEEDQVEEQYTPKEDQHPKNVMVQLQVQNPFYCQIECFLRDNFVEIILITRTNI